MFFLILRPGNNFTPSMLIRRTIWAAALAVVAGSVFVACNKDEKEDDNTGNAVVSIFAQNESFDAEGKATVNLAVSGDATEDIVTTIAVGSQAEEGFTAVAAAAVTVESSVTIAKGTKSVSVDVTVDLSKVSDGQEAVITIAAAKGAKVDETAHTAYIKVNASNSYGPKPEEGASEWSIIGTVLGTNWDTDFVAAETDGIYVVKNVTLTADSKFKFRYQKDWTVNRGGVFAEFGKGFECTQNGPDITVGTEGVYDIYYNSKLEQIGVVTTGGEIEWVSAGPAGTLDWTVEYKGCQWVEGYYAYGQLEVFEVSNTDVEKYYHVLYVDLSEDDDVAALIAEDAKVFFATLQEDIDSYIAAEMEEYDESFDEAVPYVLYNEENDGTQIMFYGAAAGNYQLAVLPITVDFEKETAKLDGTYKIINVTKTEDALEIYPWFESYNKRSDWGTEWDGWVEGYEGSYYWVAGQASGAAYVAVDSYTDDELVEYYDGNMVDMYNYTASNIADYVAAGYEMEDLAYYGLVSEVESDGSFEDHLSTYDLTGLTNVYIIAFDAEGNILADYGVSEIEIPEYVEDPIEWAERTDWALNYDATVDTGDTTYSQAVVITACDADYFVTTICDAGSSQEYTLDEIGADALYYVTLYGAYGYTVDDLAEYGIVHTSVPAVEGWTGLENGMEAYVFGITNAGKLTGEWHMEVLTGIEEVPVEPLELQLVSDWTVTLVGGIYADDEGEDVINIESNLPGIKYYLMEENTQDDLDNYYGGTVDGLISDYDAFIATYIKQGYTIGELAYSAEDPQESIYVYNPGIQTTVYVIEFDESGAATGRYGACAVTMPEASASIAKASVRKHQAGKSLRVVKSVKGQAQANRPVLQKKVRKAINTSRYMSVGRSQKAAANTRKIRKAVLR